MTASRFHFRLRLIGMATVEDKGEISMLNDEVKSLKIVCACGGMSNAMMAGSVRPGIRKIEDVCARCKKVLTAKVRVLQ